MRIVTARVPLDRVQQEPTSLRHADDVAEGVGLDDRLGVRVVRIATRERARTALA